MQDGVIRVYSYKEDIFEDIAFGPTNRDFTANAIVWDVLKSARVHPQKFDSREEERIFKVKTKANGDCFFTKKNMQNETIQTLYTTSGMDPAVREMLQIVSTTRTKAIGEDTGTMSD